MNKTEDQSVNNVLDQAMVINPGESLGLDSVGDLVDGS